MDPQVDLRLAPHLEAGERMLWSGRPAQGVRMHVTDAFLVPFSPGSGRHFRRAGSLRDHHAKSDSCCLT
jgi:hypothetical protein